MDSPALPLVLTKTLIPAPRPHQIYRRSLIKGVLGQPYFSVLLVCAPAGYGKTTLLSELAREMRLSGSPAAWISLGPEDNAPNLFGEYLCQSLIQALGPLPALSQVGQSLRASTSDNLLKVMPAIINAVAADGRTILLVIDDCHIVKTPSIIQAITFLLDNLPENFKVAVGTRARPHLPLARYRARGRLLEIDAERMKFDSNEVRDFLNGSFNIEISDDDLIRLREQTEGWAVGLQLAALALKKSGQTSFIDPGKHRYLSDYLMEEVFYGLPSEWQSILEKTSILDRMSEPLCEAVVGIVGGEKDYLKDFEENNLFILPLDEEGVWFRYHHLFRDFLFSQLTTKEKNGIPDLHRLASDWFAENGFLREAAGHAFSSDDWEYAAGFVEKHSFEMILHSEMAALSDWCARFPETVYSRHPLLCVSQCWGLVFSYQRKNHELIEKRLKQARFSAENQKDEKINIELNESEKVIRQMMAMAPDPEIDLIKARDRAWKLLKDYPTEDAAQFSILLTLGYINMALNDAPNAVESLEKARKIAFEAHLFFGIIESSFQLTRIALSKGKLLEAIKIAEDTKSLLGSQIEKLDTPLPGIGCLDIAAGCALYEQDHLDEAERRLINGLNLVGRGTNPFYSTIAYITLEKIFERQGKELELEDCLSNLEMIWTDIPFLSEGLRILSKARSGLSKSMQTQGEKWCSEFYKTMQAFKQLSGVGPYGSCEIYYQSVMVWMRLNLALGNTEQVRPFADRFYDQARKNYQLDRSIDLLLILLSSLAEQPIREVDRWMDLENLAYECEASGYFNPLNHVPEAIPAIQSAVAGRKDLKYLQSLLTKFASASFSKEQDSSAVVDDRLDSDDLLYVPLTEREIEILNLMEKGQSNQAIEDLLFITLGTVKSHVNHILAKLEAGNRTEAVARARRLGIINI